VGIKGQVYYFFSTGYRKKDTSVHTYTMADFAHVPRRKKQEAKMETENQQEKNNRKKNTEDQDKKEKMMHRIQKKEKI